MDEITTSRLTIEIGASSDNARREVTRVADALSRLRSNTNHRIKVDTKDVDKAHKKVGKLANMLNSLKRIAFYRAIRSVIKGFTDAFAVGVENAYWYSKTVGGEIGYVAEAFDRLSSAGFKADNQLGAALASLKAAVVPIMIEIIRWVTIAADKLTQLFAILGGHTTYLKAVDYTKEAYQNTAAGAAAAKEWKNQLMGFDEINRLEEPSSGGGGGGSAVPDYENMFEQAEVEDWALRFKAIWEEKIYPALSKVYNFIKEKIWPYIEKLFNFIVENIDWLLPLAAKVGLAILGWKLGKGLITGLGSVFGWLGKIHSKAGLVAIALAGLTVAGISAADAWNNGVDWKNTAGYVGGTAVAASALAVAFGSVAGAVTIATGGVGALVIGFRDWIKQGELSAPTFGLLEAGFVGLGIAIGGIPGAVVAAVGGVIVAINYFWDDLFGNAEEFRGMMKVLSGEAAQEAEELMTSSNYWVRQYGNMLSAYSDTVLSNLELNKKRFDGVKELITGDMAELSIKLKDNGFWLAREIGNALGDYSNELVGFVTSEMDLVSNAVKDFVAMFGNYTGDVENKIDGLATSFSGLEGNIRQAFGFQWEIPAPKVPHISIVPEQVFGDLRSMFGINAIPRFRVEMFAAGGFPEDGLFMANHGELVGKFSNGKTAVANNDQITEGISRAVYEAFVDAMTQAGGNGGEKEVHIYLDGRQIAETTTKYQRQFARAAG